MRNLLTITRNMKFITGMILGVAILVFVGNQFAFAQIATLIEPSPPRESTHPIADSITSLSPGERANVKGRAIAQMGSIAKVRNGAYNIEIKRMEPIEGGVQVFVRAWDSNNDPIGFGVDGTVEIERFRIINPPIMVPDGTTRVEVDKYGHETQVDNFKEDLKEALLRTLSHAIAVKKEKFSSEKIVFGKVGRTTTIVYPDTGNPGSTSVDEWLYSDQTARTWTNTIGDSTGVVVGGNVLSVGWRAHGGNNYSDLDRSWLHFDTSSIGDDDQINAATISVYGYSKNDTTGELPAIDIYTSTNSSNTTIVSNDFPNVGSVSQTGSGIGYSSWSTSAYNDFTLNSTGRANISKTGVSKFSLRSTNDGSGTQPSNPASTHDEYIRGYSADQTGSTNDPKLIVEHRAVPMAPTGLEVTPGFSGLFQEASTTALATSYQLQIATYSSSDSWSSVYWDSGKQTLSSSTPVGQRSPSITSTSTFSAGQTYYWRIKFWDQVNNEGLWSTTTPIFMIAN